jgi:hypothetical protein
MVEAGTRKSERPQSTACDSSFVFWMGCYVLSALLFLAIRETGWRAKITERPRP